MKINRVTALLTALVAAFGCSSVLVGHCTKKVCAAAGKVMSAKVSAAKPRHSRCLVSIRTPDVACRHWV